MSTIAQALPTASIFQAEATQNAHQYTTFNPEASLTRANRWSIFWKVCEQVTIIAYVAFSVIAISLTAGSTALTALVTAIVIFGVLSVSKIEDTLSEKIKGHAHVAKWASGILVKMKTISEKSIAKQIAKLGIESNSGSFEQKRLVLARYLYQESRHLSLLEKISNTETKLQSLSAHPNLILPEGNKEFSKAQRLRLTLVLLRESLAELKLDQAYTLKVLQEPCAKHSPSDFYTCPTVGSLEKLIASQSTSQIPFMYQGSTHFWTLEQVLSKTNLELLKEVFHG